MHFPRPLVLGLTLVAGTAIAQSNLPPDMPKRKPGLWEMKTSMAEMGGMGMTMQTCIDDTIEDLIAQQPEADETCEEQSYRKESNRFHFEAKCKADASTAHVKGIFSGDFSTHYQGEIHTTYTPPLHGMASSTMKMEARWLSACKPGQKPGDVMMMGMPGMGTINIEEMMKNLPKEER